jgi:hypothetical protein
MVTHLKANIKIIDLTALEAIHGKLEMQHMREALKMV